MNMIVLISTIDEYAAVWPVTCYGLRRYWPDCPWPIVWYTNRLEAPCGHTVQVGDDRHWAKMTRRALEIARADAVLLMMDDVWLAESVDTAALLDFASLLERDVADHIQLQPAPADRQRHFKGQSPHDPRLLVYRSDSPVRVCLQPGLWRVEALRSLLRDDEALPGDLENLGSRDSQGRGDRFLCLDRYGVMNYVTHGNLYHVGEEAVYWINNPVSGGKWTEGARLYAKREGLDIDFSQDPKGGF